MTNKGGQPQTLLTVGGKPKLLFGKGGGILPGLPGKGVPIWEVASEIALLRVATAHLKAKSLT